MSLVGVDTTVPSVGPFATVSMVNVSIVVESAILLPLSAKVTVQPAYVPSAIGLGVPRVIVLFPLLTDAVEEGQVPDPPNVSVPASFTLMIMSGVLSFVGVVIGVTIVAASA